LLVKNDCYMCIGIRNTFLCANSKDYVSMKLFEDLLSDEEGHIDFLETQLELLGKLGEEKYGQLNAQSASEAE